MGHIGPPNSYKSLIQHFSLSIAWQQIKMSNLHKIFMLGGGLFNKQKQKRSVKIPAVRQQWKPIFIFPIISLWKLAIATKVQMQQQ